MSSSSSNPNLINHSPRRTHRKRMSALRLSTDTTSTLPEYIPAANWQRHRQASVAEENIDDDKPPDYPDSAEEADEDTDTDSNTFYVPHPPSASPVLRAQTASPRRPKRFVPTHKRRQPLTQTYSDPYLDALLERSVHALEMSNTLLQSSRSTQDSLATVLASDSPGDSTLEARALGLSSRIRDGWDARAAWADDLEEITRGVEGLFGEEGEDGNSRSKNNSRASLKPTISASLPNSNSLAFRRNGRRPSLDLRQNSESRLQYSPQTRSTLISPPPRALTQYVASSQDSESITLPSTLGLRSPPSVHHTADWKPFTNFASSSMTSLLNSSSTALSTPSLPPQLTDKPLEPSTPAYNMLSSFVYRAPSSGSNTPSTSFTYSFMPRRRDSSVTSSGTERGSGIKRRRSSASPVSQKSMDRSHRQDRYSGFGSGSASATSTSSRIQTRGVSPMAVRPMTPPVEESSSSSDGCVAKLTVQSLRKILDEQPPPPAKARPGHDLKPPAFLPRTPAPVAEAGTSTATASISRLFTKGTHSSSARAPSPPRHSAMKRSNASTPLSLSTTPSPSPTTLSIPDLVGRVLKGSAPSSGTSTPSKRISFAELPESYASTRPPSSRFKDKSARKKRRKGTADGGKGDARDGGASPEIGGWWGGWLTGGGGGSSLHSSLARHEERIEDRMSRNWGGRIQSGFGGGLEEWAV